MQRFQEAYDTVKYADDIASKLELQGKDLTVILEKMQKPTHEALQLFLAFDLQASQTAKWMAGQLYSDTHSHPCYANDSFCIAHLFGLDKAKKRRSSMHVVENAMAGYYERVTHETYRLNDLLCGIGLDFQGLANAREEGQYLALKHDKIYELARKLELDLSILAALAENVINWCLKTGYGMKVRSSYGASTSIPVEQAEELMQVYIPSEKRANLLELIDNAKNEGFKRTVVRRQRF